MAIQTSNEFQPSNAELVAKIFVNKYYLSIHNSPETAHSFYGDSSVLGRLGNDGTMTSVTTIKGISDNIMASGYKDYKIEIISLCAQESLEGGVIVGVVGRLIRKDNDNVTRSFTQTFFLAKPDKGNFYVLNDILQFVDVPRPSTLTAQLTEDAEITHLPDRHMQTPTTTLGEKARDNGGTVSSSDIKHSSVKEVDVSKPQTNESQNDVVQVTKLATNAEENAQKTSYASIVSTMTSLVHRISIVRVSADSDKQPSAPDRPKQPSNSAVTAKTPQNSTTQAEATVIYIPGLPSNITSQRIEDAAKIFGPVHRNGIKIKHSDRFSYAFVEFESSISARRAYEAKSIRIGDINFYIQYKRFYSQDGSDSGRSSGRGGFQRDNFISGQGNSGGKSDNGYHEKGETRGSRRGHNVAYQNGDDR